MTDRLRHILAARADFARGVLPTYGWALLPPLWQPLPFLSTSGGGQAMALCRFVRANPGVDHGFSASLTAQVTALDPVRIASRDAALLRTPVPLRRERIPHA